MTQVTSSRSVGCIVCQQQPQRNSAVCEPCRAALGTPEGFLPELIVSNITPGADAALIDRWGRAHPLAASTIVGRTPAGAGVKILDSTISRAHARLLRTQRSWRVRDLGSANGTFVNGDHVTEQSLDAGDRIYFGGVGFYFAPALQALPRVALPDLSTRLRANETNHAHGARALSFTLLEPTGGGGGIVAIDSVRTRLSRSQLELIDMLARRMIADRDQPEPVRGFVRSSELVGTLSWDTAAPDDSHIKQLVRRARRRLLELGFGDLIEARHGFGYRLRCTPANTNWNDR